MSATGTTSSSFTRTNARYIASKIAADLKRFQQTYDGYPNDDRIDLLIEELTELLAGGYLESFEIGYDRDGVRVVTLRYEVRADGSLADDRAGGIPRGVDITGAKRLNYLTYSEAWFALSEEARAEVKSRYSTTRTGAPAPTDGAGYWVSDRSYSSNGTGTTRKTFRAA
ncbi:MAG: hypothetical protein REI11_10250 [Patulibacter sp.]|nr:hypothetical protein [Patulibacter sp.]